MICPRCKFEQPEGSTECPGCGIIFSKYFAHQKSISKKEPSPKPPDQADLQRRNFIYPAKELLLYVKPDINIFYFSGRALIFIIILLWGLKFIFTPLETNYTGRSFMHLINLPFHEAGHIIFRPFGEFISVLGGSLGQLLIPFICFLAFILKTRDTFAASVSIWWLGESMMDLAPYINDARMLRMILLGGVTGQDVPGYHDWQFILRKLGWLKYDHLLATIAYDIGILLMIITFVWGGYLLFRQYKNLELS